MIHHSERSTRQCARIWSDNLQLPYTSKLEVIWDQITYNLLMYNLQLPLVAMAMVVMLLMVLMVFMLVIVVVVDMVVMVVKVVMVVRVVKVDMVGMVVKVVMDRTDRGQTGQMVDRRGTDRGQTGDRQDRFETDKTDCVWQLPQFLRCFTNQVIACRLMFVFASHM